MKSLTEREQKQLLKTVRETKGKRAERDYCLLEIGFNTGLRRAEIHGLNVGDVRNMEKLNVRPEIAKRHKNRVVTIHKDLRRIIKTFIRLKLTWGEGIQDDAPLFMSRKGNRVSVRDINEIFEYWCIKSGLVFNVNGKLKAQFSVHSMRHSFATRLVQRGSSINAVQKLLGHSSLASTGVYTEATPEECEEAVNRL